ncbi:hypothetical protein HK098_008092 [Nowakowskiella sp. JEL0407]|nr:hypothetical protein HK098_008078 [Nowakowskiella sp. JEL0407]KAJ3129858.1 hypothetical protein HK098_008092 [Nowakowskiella sp. JEL0407]
MERETPSLPPYLENPSFDPSSLKINELVSILSSHDVELPATRGKKDTYVKLFQKHIIEKRQTLIDQIIKQSQKTPKRPKSGVFVDVSGLPSPLQLKKQQQKDAESFKQQQEALEAAVGTNSASSSTTPKTPKRRKTLSAFEADVSDASEVTDGEEVFSKDNPFQSPEKLVKSSPLPLMRAKSKKSQLDLNQTPTRSEIKETYSGEQVIPSPQPFMMKLTPDARTSRRKTQQDLKTEEPTGFGMKHGERLIGLTSKSLRTRLREAALSSDVGQGIPSESESESETMEFKKIELKPTRSSSRISRRTESESESELSDHVKIESKLTRSSSRKSRMLNKSESESELSDLPEIGLKTTRTPRKPKAPPIDYDSIPAVAGAIPSTFDVDSQPSTPKAKSSKTPKATSARKKKNTLTEAQETSLMDFESTPEKPKAGTSSVLQEAIQNDPFASPTPQRFLNLPPPLAPSVSPVVPKLKYEHPVQVEPKSETPVTQPPQTVKNEPKTPKSTKSSAEKRQPKTPKVIGMEEVDKKESIQPSLPVSEPESTKTSSSTTAADDIPKVIRRRLPRNKNRLAATKKDLSDGSTSLAFGSILLIFMLAGIHWYHTMYEVLGYCGSTIDSTKIPQTSNPLSLVLPTCIPCPVNAVCGEKSVMSCETEYTIRPGPIARLLTVFMPSSMGQQFQRYLPFPLNYAVCAKDMEKELVEQKRRRQVDNLIASVSELTRDWIGKLECGEISLPSEDFRYVFEKVGSQKSGMVKVLGMPLAVAQQQLKRLIGRKWTEEKFNEYWELLLERILLDSEKKELLSTIVDESRTKRLFVSNLPPHHSMACRVRRGIWSTIRAFAVEISVVGVLVVAVMYMYYRHVRMMRENNIVMVVFDDAIDAVMEEATRHQEDPVLYPVSGLPIAQIKEYLLPGNKIEGMQDDNEDKEEQKKRAEKYGSGVYQKLDEVGRVRWYVQSFGARERVWKRVVTQMQNHPSVRETSCLMNGEMQSIWTWIGSVSLTPKMEVRGSKTPKKRTGDAEEKPIVE